MDEFNMNGVSIQQTIHGYSNGHKLLASSSELSKEAQKTLLDQSDISGPITNDPNYNCITGYYIKEQASYVIAKTWYAPEMKRPGCVYTHSLLISEPDLKNKQLYLNICKSFRRPNNDLDLTTYKTPITLLPKPTPIEFKLQESAAVILNKFIESKFSKPIILNITECPDDDIYVLILSFFQQLSVKNFSFSSHSLGERTIQNKPFNLQAVSPNIIHSFLRKSDLYLKVNLLTESPTAETLQTFKNVLFEEEYAEKMLSILKTTSIEDLQLASSILSYGPTESPLLLIQAIRSRFPKENEASSFKRKIFGIKGVFNDKRTFTTLLSTEENNFISKDDLEVHERAKLLSNDDLIYILTNLMKNQPNSNGVDFLEEVARNLSSEQFTELFLISPPATMLLAQINPRLIINKSFWVDYNSEKLHLLESAVRNFTSEDISEVAQILLLNRVKDLEVWDCLLESNRKLVVCLILDFYSIEHKKISQFHISLLGKDVEQGVLWMLSHPNLDEHLFIQLCSFYFTRIKDFHFSDIEMGPFGNFIFSSRLSEEERLTAAKFLFTLAYKLNPRRHRDLIKATSSILIDALEEEQLSNRDWRIIEKVLPDMAWYNRWTAADWLKKAVKNI